MKRKLFISFFGGGRTVWGRMEIKQGKWVRHTQKTHTTGGSFIYNLCLLIPVKVD